MKLHKSLMAVMAATAAMTAMTGCDDNFDYPPVEVPHATIEANTTIAEVKESLWSDDRNYATEIGEKADGEHIIVSGRVTNNCASGNVYKSLIIQDETAALAISLNESDMSTYYKVGQEVVIDLTGLSIGKYNGLQQIGKPEVYQDGYEVTFLEPEVFTEHAQVNGLPEIAELDTMTVTMEDVRKLSTPAEISSMQSRLVRFNNVHFQGGGSIKFCDPSSSTNRTLVDENGNRMTVRMSNYATFSQNTLPGGTGDLVCILSYYGTDWQLLIRDLSDCIGFEMGDNEPGGETPAVPEANTTIADVLSKYWKSDLNYATLVEKNDKGEDQIITVRVISDDKSGNIYKQLYCQDATGAIMFAIDKADLYKDYAMGQAINVNLTGLYIGRRQGLLQVGIEGNYNGTPQPDRMDEGTWSQHASLTGSPNKNDIKIFDTTIPELSDPTKWSCQIVRLKNVHFANGGKQTYVVGGQATSQDLLDESGKSIIVRTGAYASFASETLPAGTGDVTAIMTYYNSTPQLLLNSSADCVNFDGTVTPGGDDPVTPPTGNAQFQLATSITSGHSYIFVHNGKVGSAINQTYNYGRLALVDPVSTNGNTIETDAINAITITAVEGGYTLVDAYGRFLAMDSDPTHTSSFQVYSSMREGCTWTATMKDGKAEFINVLRPELVIAQTGTYTNIAPAPLSSEGLNLPQIYEKVN